MLSYVDLITKTMAIDDNVLNNLYLLIQADYLCLIKVYCRNLTPN
jgi:hypothetical protein